MAEVTRRTLFKATGAIGAAILPASAALQMWRKVSARTVPMRWR